MCNVAVFISAVVVYFCFLSKARWSSLSRATCTSKVVENSSSIKWNKTQVLFFDSGAKGSTWQYTDVTTLKNMQTDIYIYIYIPETQRVSMRCKSDVNKCFLGITCLLAACLLAWMLDVLLKNVIQDWFQRGAWWCSCSGGDGYFSLSLCFFFIWKGE